jgi:hypothetical protein
MTCHSCQSGATVVHCSRCLQDKSPPDKHCDCVRYLADSKSTRAREGERVYECKHCYKIRSDTVVY